MEDMNAKWEKSVNQRLSYIAGQLFELNIAVGCLLKTHPNPAAAMRAMQKESEDAMSHLLPSSLDDAFIEGMSLVRNRLLQGNADE